MRQAVILVGGRGTRLGALARETPKPLMPIAGDVRFLDYLIEDIARHGVGEILLLAGHLGEAVEARYDGKALRGAHLRVIREPAPAGTAGALRHAADALDDVFLMTNGDSLLDFNHLALEAALGHGDVGALALRSVEDAARYGRVEFQKGRITGFHEKDAAFTGPALISGGVYVLRRNVLDLIETTPCSIETDVFPRLAGEGRLAGCEAPGYFIDIGLPDTLQSARAVLPQQMRRGAVFFDRDNTLNHDEGYTHRIEHLRWLPGAIEAIRRCNDAGWLVFVITNQAGVARGYYGEDDMRAFHAHMQAELARAGAHVDAFYHCPHHGDGVIEAFTHAGHPDRKPNPGMLRRALLEWPVARETSFVVGDGDADMAAAAAAGLEAYRVEPATGVLAAVEQGLRQHSRPRRDTAADAAKLLKKRAARARAWLFDAALPLWWEHGFDRETGCFHERMNQDGSPAILPRRARVQARQTVVYAIARRLGWSGPWREAVEAGAAVLVKRCLRADGGTLHLLDPEGVPTDQRRDLYDLAFVVFGLSEAASALDGRLDLIAAAEQIMVWLDSNWSHPEGGYREGDITPTPPRRQNPHMHTFEASLSLFETTGNARHLDRASRMARLFQDKFFDSRAGALPEYFDEAWRPLSGEQGRIVEPGHHFEWSWLLRRWAAAGGGDPGDIPERLRVFAELYGVDPATGITFDEVFIEGHAKLKSSRFWPHTERIKANVARYEACRDPDAAAAAAQAFDTLMRYCDTPTAGLWRDRLGADGAFVEEAAPASSFYHAALGLSELIRVAEEA